MVAVMDPESSRWVATLSGPAGADRDAAVRDLHALLLRVARAECARRAGASGLGGADLDDLAEQASDDAVVGVIAKVATFRGDSRFTTWAVAFVMFEVSAALARHVRRRAAVASDPPDWDALPARLGAAPEDVVAGRELVAAVRGAVDRVLTAHQRRVFTAVVVEGVPVDAVAADLGTTRGAVYKTVFDARGALRRALTASGHLGEHRTAAVGRAARTAGGGGA